MVRILYSYIAEEFNNKRWNHYIEMMPTSIQNEIYRYRKWEDRHSSLFSKLLLKEVLNLDKDDFSSSYKKDSFGKPYLENSKIKFNISHSKNYVICGISEIDLGLDIEYIDRVLELSYFAEIFTTDDWSEIIKSGNKKEAFFHQWSLRESICKADGRGLSAPIKDIKILQNNICSMQENVYYTAELHIDKNYKCFLAMPQEFSIKDISQVYFD